MEDTEEREGKMTMTWEEHEAEYCRTALRKPTQYDAVTSGYAEACHIEDHLEEEHEIPFAVLKYGMAYYVVCKYEPEFKVLVRDYNCGNS